MMYGTLTNLISFIKQGSEEYTNVEEQTARGCFNIRRMNRMIDRQIDRYARFNWLI